MHQWRRRKMLECMAFRTAQTFTHHHSSMLQAIQLWCPNRDCDSPFCGHVTNCIWHSHISQTYQQGRTDTLQFPNSKGTFGSCQTNDSTQTWIDGSSTGSQAGSNTEKRARDENPYICVLEWFHSCPPIHLRWKKSASRPLSRTIHDGSRLS